MRPQTKDGACELRETASVSTGIIHNTNVVMSFTIRIVGSQTGFIERLRVKRLDPLPDVPPH